MGGGGGGSRVITTQRDPEIQAGLDRLRVLTDKSIQDINKLSPQMKTDFGGFDGSRFRTDPGLRTSINFGEPDVIARAQIARGEQDILARQSAAQRQITSQFGGTQPGLASILTRNLQAQSMLAQNPLEAAALEQGAGRQLQQFQLENAARQSQFALGNEALLQQSSQQANLKQLANQALLGQAALGSAAPFLAGRELDQLRAILAGQKQVSSGGGK